MLQTSNHVRRCKARVDGCVPHKHQTDHNSEWTLNLVGVPPVNMAGLVIYLMDVCTWKDDAVPRYQVTVTDYSAKDIFMM